MAKIFFATLPAKGAFVDLDRHQVFLNFVREEPLHTERTKRFNEIREPFECRVREYLGGAYREDGLDAFRDANLAEDHIAGLSETANANFVM